MARTTTQRKTTTTPVKPEDVTSEPAAESAATPKSETTSKQAAAAKGGAAASKDTGSAGKGSAASKSGAASKGSAASKGGAASKASGASKGNAASKGGAAARKNGEAPARSGVVAPRDGERSARPAVVRPQPAHAAIPGTGAHGLTHPLRNMSEIRHHFRTSMQQVFFVGATAFNLLGVDRWVRGFSFVAYYDGWDGAHQNVFTPAHKPYIEFESGEEINNWLLRNPEVRAHIAHRTPPGTRPQVAMVFFDEETEQICEELGYELILPEAALRDRLDSKIVTTRLADEVGVASVPNIIATVRTWEDVVAAATGAGLGTDLVIQTAYGDSGKTTFFVTGKADFARIAAEIGDEPVKIMKRIDNLPVAVEAVITRHGTVVGPCMTEITGHRALTPYRGGWSGNEMFAGVLDDQTRHTVTDLIVRLGDRLREEGYLGFFEVDVLVDTSTGMPYLGELNPRISGASAVTNVTAGAYADVPLFVFHLLEYAGVDFELDVHEINERWDELASDDEWSTMVIKHVAPTVDRIDVAPETGRYVVGADGHLRFARSAPDWHLLTGENEAFFLRVYGPGDYRWKGADLGILVTKGRMQTQRGTLTIRAKQFIDAIRDMYVVTTVPDKTHRPAPAAASKGL